MNRNCLFNKAIALLLCAVMLVGFLPSVAFGAAADEWKPDDNEGPLDVFETTEAPTEPVGSKGNPEPIIDSATATLEENDDGYYYVYSNTVDGTLSVNVTTWDAYGYQYEITNKTAGGDPIVKKDESPATVKYTAGDEIVICVNTYMEETKPAGSVDVTVSFMQGWGTAEKPYILTEQNNSVAIPAGEQAYYRCYFGGTEMTVVAYGAYTLTVAGQAVPVVYDEVWESYTAVTPVTAQGRQPFDFAITNSTEGELSVDINFDYPEGSVNKPKEIYGTDSDTANIAAGSTGYYYSFFSAVNGTLTITVTADTAFMVDVNNYEFVKEAAAGETVTYTMEHTAQFNEDFDVIPVPVYVNTVNPESMWNNPAGNIKVDFSFVVGMGTQEEPFQLEEENTLTIPDGETYYYSCNFDGKIMTINGEAYALTINGGETLNLEGEYSTQVTMGDERIILIGLMNDSDAPITVVFSDPVGSMDNPEEIKLDTEYTHEFAAGDNGYFYTYTAEEDGNLIVSISGTNGWTYTINNLTAYAYGDRITSADENVVPEAIVPVSVGDEIVICVTSYDAENPYSIPAGSVTIKVAYQQTECEVHDWEHNITKPTSKVDGVDNRVCKVCGHEDPVTLHCGDYRLRFAGATLELQSDLSVLYNVKAPAFEEYENIYLVVEIDDEYGEKMEPVIITEYTAAGDVMSFAFQGVAPYMMKHNIHATLYGTRGDYEYSYSLDYAAATYCYSQLGVGYGEKFDTLIVDLLNYGTQQQYYMSKTLDNLINAELTDEQRALASSADALEVTDYTDTKYIDTDTRKMRFTSVTVDLQYSVKFLFSFTTVTGATVNADDLRVVLKNGSQEFEATEFIDSGDGTYSVYFDCMKANQFRDKVEVTIYEGDLMVSRTLLYSIESYAAGKIADPDLKDIVSAVMMYGDSAYRYFN